MKPDIRLLLALPAVLLAQNTGLSLAQCRSLAIARDPALMIDSLSRESASLQERSARSAWLPSVGASVAYNRLSEVDNPGVTLPLPDQLGGPRNVVIATSILDQYVSSIRVDQLLWDGMRSRGLTASARAEQAAWNATHDRDRRDLETRVASGYWGLQASQVALDASRRAMARADSQATFTRFAYLQGTALEQDTLQARLRVRQIELVVEEAQAAVEYARQGLATAMGVPLAFQLVATDSLVPMAAPVEGSAEARVELLEARSRTEAAMGQEAASRSTYWPMVQASGQYDWNNPNQRIFPNREEFDGSWRIGVAASWNLYRGGADDLASRRAALAVRQARLRETAVSDALAQDLARRRTEYRLAHRKREIVSSSLPLSERDLELARIRAEAGTALRLDAIDRAAALAQTESDLARAIAAENTAALNLAIALGAAPRWK